MARSTTDPSQRHPPTRAAWALVLTGVLLLVPVAGGNHVQSAGGQAIAFDHKTGNEWWVEVMMTGPSTASITRVEAKDDGGPWVALSLRSWGAWAASFHIEPGHDVEFRATFSDASQILSCRFTHPLGVELCNAPPPPPPSGEVVFDHKTGNQWWLEAVLSGAAVQGVTAVHAMDSGGSWTAMTFRSWGAWAVSFHIEPGHEVRFRATMSDGSQQVSCWFTHPAGVKQCGGPPPPPPPPPSAAGSLDAESFLTKTTGAKGTSSYANGGAYWNLWSNGHIEDSLSSDGPSTLSVIARGTPLGGVWPRMQISVDDVAVGTVTVGSASFAEYGNYPLTDGTHKVKIAFTNDAANSREDRNLHVDLARIIGPGPVPCVDPRGCPDLRVDASAFAPYTETRTFGSNSCAVQEGSIEAGQRRLLRFAFVTPNDGPGNLLVGSPALHPEWFDWATCHGHHHFHEYADYTLWTPSTWDTWDTYRNAHPNETAAEALVSTGLEPIQGGKQGFCVVDVLRYGASGPASYTSCSFQGLTVDWADEYGPSLDGQWIDITGVASGAYVLEAEVNAERLYVEGDYANNRGSLSVTI